METKRRLLNTSHLTRREFLGAPAAGATLAAGVSVAEAARQPRFSGFIVSDAHFGWDSPVQPSPAESRRAMQHIMARFPDLDVFVDTGDAHHSGVEDAARGDWTDIIPGGCGTAPFLYCMGNHEQIEVVRSVTLREDVEARTCRLGGLSCRPYQSWNLKGIHLVVAPELMEPSYVDEELLDWLELDLSLHRDLTTIVFSHNSLKDTTKSGWDTGYRQVVNSSRVLDLLCLYPNVVAWMHGHNHTWELVPALGKLFVSNGRIGGFDPGGPGSSGKGHLGGIYFEIGSGQLTVRGYSVTRKAFFDEFDTASGYMHRTLPVKATFNPSAPAAVCYGMGRSRDGQRMPVYRHHALAGSGRTEVFLAGAASPVFNENSGLQLYTERLKRDGKVLTKVFPGFSIAPAVAQYGDPEPDWEWANPGVRLKAVSDTSIRRAIQTLPHARGSRFEYYHCAPGMRLRVDVEAACDEAGPRLQLVCHVCDSNGQKEATTAGPWWNLTKKPEVLSHEFELPALGEPGTIYRETTSDAQLQTYVEAVVAGLRSDVLVRRLELRFAGAQAASLDAAISLDGQKTEASGRLAAGETHRVKWTGRMEPRAVAEVSAGGSRLITWLVRETGIEWQVRNAPATHRDGWLEIGALRNNFSPRQEVVIVPLGGNPALYVHRLRKVNGARVRPATKQRHVVTIELQEILGPAEVEIVCPKKPRRVEGADSSTFKDGRLVVARASTGVIRVTA